MPGDSQKTLPMPPVPPSENERGFFAANSLQIAIALLLLAAVVQTFIISAGWKDWSLYTDYYRRLTDSFLHGQVSLRTLPAPGLLAMKNPYIPELNGRYRLHDAILFNGKYYFYWGPVPALLAAVVCRALGVSEPTFGDQYLVLLFLFGTVLIATTLIFLIRGSLFSQLRPATAILPVLSLTLGAPMLFTLARAAIYEAAIAAGQFFLLSGLLAAWLGLRDRRWWMLGIAGVCWAMSLGSRISLLPAIFVVTLLTLWRTRDFPARKWAGAAALVIPLVAAAVLLGWYNLARFGSITELGLRYQLAADDQYNIPMSTFASWRFIVPDLAIYLFAPAYRIKLFPYFIAFSDRPAWAAVFHFSRRYHFESVVGLAWSQPFLVFSAVALVLALNSRRAAEHRVENWLILSLASGAALGFLAPLTLGGVTMRYLLDVVPCCSVLAALGYFQALTRLANRPRPLREVRAAARLVVAAQSVLGLLLGITGYYMHFAIFNEPLFSALRRMFPVVRI